MPLNKLPKNDESALHDPEVKTARAAVHESLSRFEENVDRLAMKIESVKTIKAVAIGLPMLKYSWRALRFISKNPKVFAVTGGIAGSIWLYRLIQAKRELHKKK